VVRLHKYDIIPIDICKYFHIIFVYKMLAKNVGKRFFCSAKEMDAIHVPVH